MIYRKPKINISRMRERSGERILIKMIHRQSPFITLLNLRRSTWDPSPSVARTNGPTALATSTQNTMRARCACSDCKPDSRHSYSTVQAWTSSSNTSNIHHLLLLVPPPPTDFLSKQIRFTYLHSCPSLACGPRFRLLPLLTLPPTKRLSVNLWRLAKSL